MNHHVLTGAVDITSNLLVGTSHLFVDTDNNRVGLVTADPHAGLHVNSNAFVSSDLRVGSSIVMNDVAGHVKAATFEGDGSLLQNVPAPQGDPATIELGTVSTGDPGTNVIITDSNASASGSIFNFTIPRGDVGPQGIQGDAATIAVGTVSTGTPGSSATVINSGTVNDAVLDFTIPRGDVGPQGIQGIQGDAATINIGSVTTGVAGSSATVTNSGTTGAAVLDFNIPKGDKGDAATIDIGTITTGVAGSSATVTNSGTVNDAILNFNIPRGDKGDTGVAATITVGSVTTGAAGSSATVTNSGTTSDAVLNFTIPKGDSSDATTLDGIDSSSFLRSDADDTVNAGVTYSWAATDTHGIQFQNSSYPGYYLYMGGWTSSNNNNISRIRNSNGNLHIDSAANGNLYLNWYSGGTVQCGSQLHVYAPDSSTAEISAYGSSQGTGRLYLGQSSAYGGGIEYNGDSNPVTSGAGSDQIALYRRDNGNNYWTARNPYNANDWYFRGTVYVSGTSQGLRSATGNYGTVQTTGGGNGGWEGYSIDGRYVFMSSDSNSCGIYNDVDNEWMIYCYRNNYVKLYYNGGERFITTSYGNSIQGGGLRIHVFEATIDYANSQHDWWTNGGQIQADAPNLNFSLYCAGSIRAPAYVAFSDVRIKKDFLEIDDTLALEKLRQLKPTTYRYKDKTRNTTDRVIGFIAQEVAEVLPNAVSRTHGILPNIQCEASIEILSETDIKLILVEPLPIDHTITPESKLILKTPKYEHMEFEVVSLESDTTIIIKGEDGYDKIKSETRVWVFGEEVNDFHHLDKNAIFTIATAALQEVDRRQQVHKERITDLEIQLQAEKQKTTNLQLMVASLLTRITKLEEKVR